MLKNSWLMLLVKRKETECPIVNCTWRGILLGFDLIGVFLQYLF